MTPVGAASTSHAGPRSHAGRASHHHATTAASQSAVRAFVDLPLDRALLRVLAEQGLTVPTPIQSATLPDAIAGHDVLGRARTGSGKTLAFGLGLFASYAQALRHLNAIGRVAARP